MDLVCSFSSATDKVTSHSDTDNAGHEYLQSPRFIERKLNYNNSSKGMPKGTNALVNNELKSTKTPE